MPKFLICVTALVDCAAFTGGAVSLQEHNGVIREVCLKNTILSFLPLRESLNHY